MIDTTIPFVAIPRHTAENCAIGKCSHAVSERVPCRCPDCDPETARMVAGYALRAAHDSADEGSKTTPRFAERTFDRFIRDEANEPAYLAACGVVDDVRCGLALCGSMGVGKSHLAAAIVNACKANDVAARFVGVEDLLSRIRATYDAKGAATEHSIIATYVRVPVLVLDDFGKETLSDFAVRTMFSLVNRRYEQNLPLVITSNFSREELLVRRVGRDAEPMTYASTMDRIGEMCGRWITMSGRSRR